MMKCQVGRFILGKRESTEGVCPTKLYIYPGFQIKANFLFGVSGHCLPPFSESIEEW
jgi:hypothetical protein